MSNIDGAKEAAALRALDFVEDGMRLGLGTGSTAEFFVRGLGEKVSAGLNVVGVPTSERTGALAAELGIPLSTLDETPQLDLTVDGADEVDSELRLIKGGGGALLREKIVASASSQMVVIIDPAKMVETLGAFPLPVEVVPFGWRMTAQRVSVLAERFGCTGHEVRLRETGDGKTFVTDGGHYIVDCLCQSIGDADGLWMALNVLPGVVENGLFIGLASAIVIGEPDGNTRVIDRG